MFLVAEGAKAQQCLSRDATLHVYGAKQRALAARATSKKAKAAIANTDVRPPKTALYNTVSMTDCKKVATRFAIELATLHEDGFVIQSADGSCFDGAAFRQCDPRSRTQRWGIDVAFAGRGGAQYMLHRWQSQNECLLAKGGKVAVGACSGGAARAWSVDVAGGKITSNGGKSCLQRNVDGTVLLGKCKAGAEPIAIGTFATPDPEPEPQQQQALPNTYQNQYRG
jgi:hypothetical protein